MQVHKILSWQAVEQMSRKCLCGIILSWDKQSAYLCGLLAISRVLRLGTWLSGVHIQVILCCCLRWLCYGHASREGAPHPHALAHAHALCILSPPTRGGLLEFQKTPVGFLL